MGAPYELASKYRQRHWDAAPENQRREQLAIDHRDAIIEDHERFPNRGNGRWGPMHIDLQGVCVWLNLGITEFICDIRTRDDAATRINLCLNGISIEDAYRIVDTNGLFTVDETTGRIQGHEGTRVPGAGTL